MAGSTRITASGVVGVSGKPVRIYGYTMRSLASGPGVVQLFDGTNATGNERWKGTGNQDDGAIVAFSPAVGIGGVSSGKFFATGAYCQIDTDVSYVEFDYDQVTT